MMVGVRLPSPNLIINAVYCHQKSWSHAQLRNGRVAELALGYSGVRPVVAQTLTHMLNSGVHPVIPSKGSVGASGDLAPLAHLALCVIGEGEAIYRGERMPGRTALERAGIDPVRLQAKEGLALLNGTQALTAVGALALWRATRLAGLADVS